MKATDLAAMILRVHAEDEKWATEGVGVGGSSEDIVRVQESVSSRREPGNGKQLNKFAFMYFPLRSEMSGTCDQ